jgi:cobalt-zinc-cadmium resistance protein CzcA
VDHHPPPVAGSGRRGGQSVGCTTKEFEVQVDRDKLDAYSITIPQLISAINNANINVDARTINVGQQSINIRGRWAHR